MAFNAAKSSDVLLYGEDICKNKGVMFLDYYADMDFVTHSEWLKEPMHLNAEGVREYSKRVLSEMKSLLDGE